MNGNSIVVDTNIVLYLLNGNYKLAKQLDKKIIYVSFITELELLGYKALNKSDRIIIQNFLNECRIIGINKNIKINTIKIKQETKVKLPDALIAATSQFIEIPLITSDNGFNKIKNLDLHLFEI